MSNIRTWSDFCTLIFIIFKKDFSYLFMRDTETEGDAETQAGGEAGSMQGAQCGTRSRVSRIMPWTEGGAKPLSHWGCPKPIFIKMYTQGSLAGLVGRACDS